MIIDKSNVTEIIVNVGLGIIGFLMLFIAIHLVAGNIVKI